MKEITGDKVFDEFLNSDIFKDYIKQSEANYENRIPTEKFKIISEVLAKLKEIDYYDDKKVKLDYWERNVTIQWTPDVISYNKEDLMMFVELLQMVDELEIQDGLFVGLTLTDVFKY